MTPDWLVYQNQGATRSQPLSPELVKALGFLPEMGLQMQVFSGGQEATGPNRVGSHRHDHGGAADVFFARNGQRLNWANPADLPIFEEIVRRAKAGGVTGFGAGPGYMQPGSMHIGFGDPAVWGAEGKGANAPDWLRQAYGGAPAGPAPAMQPNTQMAAAGQPGAGYMPTMPLLPDGAPSGLAGLFDPQPSGPTPQMQARAQQQADAEAEQRRKEALFGGTLFG